MRWWLKVKWLTDVTPQNTLEHLGSKSTFDNKTLLTIKRSTCTQLGQQERHHVLRLPMHSTDRQKCRLSYAFQLSDSHWKGQFQSFQSRRKRDPGQVKRIRKGRLEKAYVLQRSMKLTKTVFLVPSRRTCGGLMIVRLLSAESSGLFSLKILNTRPRSCADPAQTINSRPRAWDPYLVNKKVKSYLFIFIITVRSFPRIGGSQFDSFSRFIVLSI